MGYFDPGVTPTDQQILGVGKYDPKSFSSMSPEELDQYLKAQRANTGVANNGKGWSDDGAYNAFTPALAAKYAGDPNRAQRIEGGLQTEQQIATNGWNGAVDSNAYNLGGDPAFAANERNRLLFKGDAAGLRTGPTVDTSTVTPWQGGALTAGMGQVAAGARQGGAGDLLYGTAQGGGAGTGLQGDAGKSLLALGQMPAGPSAAELAMSAQGEKSLQQQSAMAAGARGGNAALALQNAAANQGSIQGETQRNLGVQRASEDMANRTFAANAISGSANIFANQDAQRIAAAQAAGSTFGGAGSTFGGAGQTFTNNAGINANIAQANATNEGAQRGRNDAREVQYDQFGNAITAAQTGLNTEADQHRVSAYQAAQRQHNENTKTDYDTDSITGSPALDKLAGTAIQTGATAAMVASDVRAKKDVKPADKKISDAFREAGDPGAAIRGTEVDYGVPPAIYPGQGAADPLFGSVPRRAAMAPAITSRVYDPKPIAPYVPDYLRRPGYDSLAQDIPMYARPPQADPGLSRDNPFVSDVRAKKDIAPAGGRISDAFRDAASANASSIGGTDVDYPQELRGYNPPATPEQLAQFAEIDRQAAIRRRPQPTDLFYDPSGEGTFRNPVEQMRYATAIRDGYPPAAGYQYKYKDPKSPGARPGEQYGIMAQDLEQTPAGKTVVGEDKKGRKYVDPDRLSLMTAAEVAKQRRELDLLMGRRAAQ